MAEEKPVSVLPELTKQVEFYFSDSNLPRDNFLRNLVQKNKDGWVPLDVIASFNKIKKMSTDMEKIVSALRASAFLEVSEDGKNVRRGTPVPGDASQIVFNRSIYAKGFPETATLEEVTSFFAAHGTVRSVRLRRRKDKLFKGSVFVELDSPEQATEVAAKQLTFNEAPLTLMTKAAYFASKKESKGERHKKKKSDDQKEDGSNEPHSNKRKAEGEGERKEEEGYPRKRFVLFTGLPASTQWKDMKNALTALGFGAKFIDFIDGNTKANVRFGDSVDTEAMIAKFESEKLQIGGSVPTLKLVEGDEEKALWDVVKANSRGGGSNKRHKRR